MQQSFCFFTWPLQANRHSATTRLLACRTWAIGYQEGPAGSGPSSHRSPTFLLDQQLELNERHFPKRPKSHPAQPAKPASPASQRFAGRRFLGSGPRVGSIQERYSVQGPLRDVCVLCTCTCRARPKFCFGFFGLFLIQEEKLEMDERVSEGRTKDSDGGVWRHVFSACPNIPPMNIAKLGPHEPAHQSFPRLGALVENLGSTILSWSITSYLPVRK